MIRLSQTSAFSWDNCSVDTVYHLRFSKHPTFTVNGVVPDSSHIESAKSQYQHNWMMDKCHNHIPPQLILHHGPSHSIGSNAQCT
jgi:hypothetical protein